MRKICISLIYFLIIGSCIVSYAQEEERYPRIGFIKNDRTNIRAGDNLNFEVLCQVCKGDRVKVLEKRYNWYKVLLPKNAYVFLKKEYVNSGNGIGIVNANNVNVRARPGTNFTIVSQLNKGDSVKIIEELEGWYKIQPENFPGWIYSDLITFTPLESKPLTGSMLSERKPEILKKGSEKEEAGKQETYKIPLQNTSSFRAETLTGFTARGLLLGTGRIINRPGTHKLILDTSTSSLGFARDDPERAKRVEGSLSVNGVLRQAQDASKDAEQGRSKRSRTIDTKEFYYLKSDKVNLNRFINSKVEVKGRLVENTSHKPYLILVDSVEPVR